MIDYRTLSAASLSDTITSYGRSIRLADDVLDGLLAVAVWHSVKDGQVTPAIKLLAESSRNMKDKVSQYLTKFGNIKYSKEKGLQFDKNKVVAQFGIDAANALFESGTSAGVCRLISSCTDHGTPVSRSSSPRPCAR